MTAYFLLNLFAILSFDYIVFYYLSSIQFLSVFLLCFKLCTLQRFAMLMVVFC